MLGTALVSKVDKTLSGPAVSQRVTATWTHRAETDVHLVLHNVNNKFYFDHLEEGLEEKKHLEPLMARKTGDRAGGERGSHLP